MPEFSRPLVSGPELFEARADADDPAVRAEAGARVAHLLVRGSTSAEDRETAERIVHLADDQGLDLLAELWAGAPSDSLAGALWRLYVLRTWVRRDPVTAAAEFEAGRRHVPVAEVVAGVVDPPGPREVEALTDQILHGVVLGDLADALDRAAAFAHVVGVGRASQGRGGEAEAASAARLTETAAALQRAAAAERSGELS